MNSMPFRYSSLQRRLHWLMVILIAAAYLLIEQRGVFGRPGRFVMLQSHFWVGIGIFVLAWWRLVQRGKRGVPPITPALPAWQDVLSTAMHYSLYAFFLVMPILGISAAWLDGKSVFIPFTQIAIPALLPENELWAHSIEDLHGDIGNIFYYVIGFHIAAALYHHFVRKDDTLKRMR